MRNHGALNTSVGILWAITLAAIFYLVVLLTMSVAAKAADYTLTVGQQATFGLSINACDTQVQIEDIVAANEKDGFMAGVAPIPSGAIRPMLKVNPPAAWCRTTSPSRASFVGWSCPGARRGLRSMWWSSRPPVTPTSG